MQRHKQRFHKITEVGGLKQAGDFDYLKRLIKENPGCTEGIVNTKFLPYPKKYKNLIFQVVLGTGQIKNATLQRFSHGLKWFDSKGEIIKTGIFAWRECKQNE